VDIHCRERTVLAGYITIAVEYRKAPETCCNWMASAMLSVLTPQVFRPHSPSALAKSTDHPSSPNSCPNPPLGGTK
jgi:hypothetical protein